MWAGTEDPEGCLNPCASLTVVVWVGEEINGTAQPTSTLNSSLSPRPTLAVLVRQVPGLA